MIIGTNPKLLYNRRKLPLLAVKTGCICTPLTSATVHTRMCAWLITIDKYITRLLHWELSMRGYNQGPAAETIEAACNYKIMNTVLSSTPRADLVSTVS